MPLRNLICSEFLMILDILFEHVQEGGLALPDTHEAALYFIDCDVFFGNEQDIVVHSDLRLYRLQMLAKLSPLWRVRFPAPLTLRYLLFNRAFCSLAIDGDRSRNRSRLGCVSKCFFEWFKIKNHLKIDFKRF